MDQTLVNFYKFFKVSDPAATAAEWKNYAATLELKGTLILAPEGVNASLWGVRLRVEEFLAFVRTAAGEIRPRFTSLPDSPFHKLVAKTRAEIVTFGHDVDQRMNHGRFISPHQVHDLARQGSAVFLDTRNTYESAIGTFQGALTPQMDSFREFSDVVARLADKKEETIIAFCTGGIRCEKAVPYMVASGFKHVYQIEGGILAYLEKYPEGAFKGQCFVFDDRYTIQADGSKGDYTACPDCGEPAKDGVCVICGPRKGEAPQMNADARR